LLDNGVYRQKQVALEEEKLARKKLTRPIGQINGEVYQHY